MRAEGYREVQLWTPREAPARRFYEATGWRHDGREQWLGRAGAADRRLRQAAVSAGRPLRVYLGAFGDPGHAFPMLALGEALVARGHAVALQTWRRWRGGRPRRPGSSSPPRPSTRSSRRASGRSSPTRPPCTPPATTVPSVEAFAPDVAVSDILTPAPALAAELCGVPVATLVPHVHPWSAPGFPPYSLGARLPRTRGRARGCGAASTASSRRGSSRGGASTTTAARGSGSRRCRGVHTGLSRALTLVGTLPQLEYPRRWEPWLRVVGPLLWEPPGEQVAPPPGDGPVVLVAPSTAQDPEHAHAARGARRAGAARRCA